ncbi:MAG: hypothetical protein AB7N76_12585 [Planctomycetota bacterium]
MIDHGRGGTPAHKQPARYSKREISEQGFVREVKPGWVAVNPLLAWDDPADLPQPYYRFSTEHGGADRDLPPVLLVAPLEWWQRQEQRLGPAVVERWIQYSAHRHAEFNRAEEVRAWRRKRTLERRDRYEALVEIYLPGPTVVTKEDIPQWAVARLRRNPRVQCVRVANYYVIGLIDSHALRRAVIDQQLAIRREQYDEHLETLRAALRSRGGKLGGSSSGLRKRLDLPPDVDMDDFLSAVRSGHERFALPPVDLEVRRKDKSWLVRFRPEPERGAQGPDQ